MLIFYIINCIVCFVLLVTDCIRVKKSIIKQGYDKVLQEKKEANGRGKYEELFIVIVKALAVCMLPLLNTIFIVLFLIILFSRDKELDKLVREEMIKDGLMLNSIVK